jgi:multiple sugar transport system substrate-binding protein
VTWPAATDDAWTADEFSRVLAVLARHDQDHKVLDVKLNYGVGEWLTYGFGPLVASAGGDLLDPTTLQATGHLDGPAAQEALRALAGWSPYVDANEKDDAFTGRRVALSWVGHWAYPDYAEALGDDLLLLPLPDLGQGVKTGQGSWAWAVTGPETAHAAAATFLRFLLRDREVLRMADANGAVPGTRTALAKSTLYQPGGPLRLFAEQLLHSCGDQVPSRSCVAVPRPVTPGYPTLTAGFAAAVAEALAGRDPVPALHAAAQAVDRDVAVNSGFR